MTSEEERQLRQRLADLESLLDALQNHEVDAVVGREHVLLLRLKDYEERYSSLLQNLPDVIFRLDDELRYQYISPVAKLYEKIEPSQMLQKTAREAGMPEADWLVFERACREVIENGEPRHVDFARETSHGLRDLQSRLFPEHDENGAVTHILGITTDLTEQRKAQLALRRSEERLEAELVALTRLHELVSRLIASPDLEAALDEVLNATIAISGADMGNIQLFDEESGDLNIFAHKGFQQDFLDFFKTVTSEDGCGCGRALLGGERVIIENVNEDPDYAPYREIAKSAGFQAVQSTPLKSRDGKLFGILSTHYSQPRRPSDRVLKLLDLYAQQASDFIEHFQNAEKAKLESRRKDEFLATLAHELRNPLAPIATGLHLLKTAPDKLAVFDEVHATMERQTQQLVTLVDDLLDVSRITRGKLELKKRRVALADVVRSAVEEAKPLVDAAQHELSVALPEEPVSLHADPHRLAQVLSNLLNNAAKYTPSGGKIWLTAERLGTDRLRLVVKDTGIGVPPEMRDSVFEMFSQIDHSSDEIGSGLGIGLTLVRSLVRLHGGTVEVHSDGPNLGSSFAVELPISTSAPAEEAETPTPPPAPTTGIGERRILIVDDNESAARMLSLVMESVGHQVRTAVDGREALETADEFRPQVVLMDLGMPRMNGHEAARSIRMRPWGKDVTLVALTGWGKEEDRLKSKDAGFDAHLVKPADPAKLLELIQQSP